METSAGRKVATVASMLMIASAFMPQAGRAQGYPSKPIRIVVPGTGGGGDFAARLIGQGLSPTLGQPIVIENRPGASAIIGADALAKATPDGHTIGMLGNNHTILEALGRKTPYDLYKDFAPLMRIAVLDNVIVVHPSVPAKDMKELVALMRAHPDKYR